MCGRFTLTSPRDLIERRFELELAGLDLTPRYNIAPSQSVLAIAIGRSGARTAVPMRFGLVPYWSSEARTRLSTINARLESLATSRVYAGPLRRHRCLVVADGYYEWQKQPGTRRKTPYWIARPDRAPFAFAGLYDVWRPRDGGPPLVSCAIVTAAASETFRAIHDRAPVILRPDVESAWIDTAVHEPDALLRLLDARDDAALVAREVSPAVGSPENDGPELIEPVAEGRRVEADGSDASSPE